MDGKACCLPARDTLETESTITTFDAAQRTPKSFGAVNIPWTQGLVGTNAPCIPQDGEGPLRKVKLKPYSLMATTVTNAMFEAFVTDTGYVTEAESIGWSFVFQDCVPEGFVEEQSVAGVPWWKVVDGANWRAINGPGSDEQWQPDHPAVQISWNDARAFASWAGGRLPTEAEWETAARAGQGDVPFPWGQANEPDDESVFPCNIWQGHFPQANWVGDGHRYTAPAQSFEPNPLGLSNMCGNVWEWTSDLFKVRSLSKSAKKQGAMMQGMKVMKGGSFLCHRSYCYRYRIAARTGTTPDSATPHQGFRLAFDR